MAVDEPRQECPALGELIRRQRRRAFPVLLEYRADAVPHIVPILDRRTHVVQHAGDVGGECIELRRIDDPVDLDVNHRFAPRALGVVGDADQRPLRVANDGHDRVDDQVQRQTVPIDFHRHRVDQERHVVVHDLDDRVRRLPAVLLDRWIEDTDAGVRRIAPAREVPVRQRGAVQIGRRPFGEIFGIDLTVVAQDERRERIALLGGDLRLHQPEHFLEALRAAEFGGYRHGGLYPVAPAPRAQDMGVLSCSIRMV